MHERICSLWDANLKWENFSKWYQMNRNIDRKSLWTTRFPISYDLFLCFIPCTMFAFTDQREMLHNAKKNV